MVERQLVATEYQQSNATEIPSQDGAGASGAPQDPPDSPIPSGQIEALCAARDGALKTMAEAAALIAAGHAKARAAAEIAEGAHHGHSFALYRHQESPHYDRLFGCAFDAEASCAVYRKELDASIWTYLLERCGLEQLMDRTAREDLERAMVEEVPEIEDGSIRATLQALMGQADLIFQRGLAKAFSDLDRRFRSHDGFKLGSRVILNYVFDDWGCLSHSSRVRATLIDLERVFAVLDGKPPRGASLIDLLQRDRRGISGPRQSEVVSAYFRIRGFKNGNAHLWFTRDDLVEAANKQLAEFYGAVIGDAMPKDATAEDLKHRPGLPAKDLAFFPTPPAVVEALLRDLYIRDGDRVLEPSAGTGAIAVALAGKGALVDCVEIHPGRARDLAGLDLNGGTVVCANFLNLTPRPIYDRVVMNPPFSGTHWMDHVRHAFGFLKSGGTLSAVLPVTADIGDSGRHTAFRLWMASEVANSHGPAWRDLPAESFGSVGTRVHTGILTVKKR